MPKRCLAALLLGLAVGGCGSEPSRRPVHEMTRGFGMGAAIRGFDLARRDDASPAVEPGRHLLAAAPCSRFGRQGIAVVELFPEVAAPRCLAVTPDERILVVNRTGAFHRHSAVSLTVRLGDYSARLAPQQAAFFAAPVGRYLATGLHGLRASRSPGPSVLVVTRRCAPVQGRLRLLKPIERCF